VTHVYLETTRSVMLIGKPERRVEAVTYVVDRSHAQYAGRLNVAEQLHLVRRAHGQSGANRDYVLATVTALETLGCRDAELHRLALQLRGTHEAQRQPQAGL
jgi:cation transport protein ChaC